MEKISALIDKLQELKNTNAGLQAISYYVQLLQAELLHARSQAREKENGQSQSQIAVIMPSTPLSVVNHIPEHHNHTAVSASVTAEPVVIKETSVVTAPAAAITAIPATATVPAPLATTITATAPAAANATPVTVESKSDATTLIMPQQPPATRPVVSEPAVTPTSVPVAVQTPVTTQTSTPAQATTPASEEKKTPPAMITLFPQPHHPAAEEKTIPAAHERKDNNLVPVYSTSANSGVRKELKELNQLVAQQTTSLNDRLRQDQQGVSERFGDMPVKDLRQAIGINDKFRFIQELFRGDVDTYERSVKTINEFQTLQEAEYWIERELKIRQGWEDDNIIVRQFYNLVRKRFS